MGFSLITNYEKIKIQELDGRESKYSSLYGIRVLSSIVVIVSHVLMIVALLSPNLTKQFESISPVVLPIPTLSIETFLLISGLMSGKWFYRKWRTTNGKVNVYEYYLARLLKIAPIYYLTFWFYLITINKLIVGRFKEEIVENICSKNWIFNILFVFNFISSEEMVSEKNSQPKYEE
jgi:peptidoglycan/LPS O-acetylase OafA/YrhL